MSDRSASLEKSRFVFESVFKELGILWIGPEFDFDRDSFKARIQAGPLKGNLVYISAENLEDGNVSAENIKESILGQLKLELANQRN